MESDVHSHGVRDMETHVWNFEINLQINKKNTIH